MDYSKYNGGSSATSGAENLTKGGTTNTSGLTQAFRYPTPAAGYSTGYGAQPLPWEQPKMQQEFSMYGQPGNLSDYEGQQFGTLTDGTQGWGTDVTNATAGVSNGVKWGTGDGTAIAPTSGFAGARGKFDFGQSMGTAKDALDVIGTGYNIYNAYQGNQRANELLGFAREEANRAKDQWGITLEELGRIRRVRTNLTQGYLNGGNYKAQEANNPSERPSKYVS